MNFSQMSLPLIFSYATAIIAVIIVVMSVYKGKYSLQHGAFALGMLVLALEAIATGSSMLVSSKYFLFWQSIKLVIDSLLPGVWLCFSIIFARTNYSEQLSKWKLVLILSFIIPLSMLLPLRSSFFAGKILVADSKYFLPLGWSGYIWHLCSVLISILVLMNLERTLRHSIGHTRWQIKFMLLGIGGVFGIRIFIDSQSLLFHGINSGLGILNVWALFVANIFVFSSLLRGNPLNVSVYLSHKFLYNSLTVFVIGIYFILIAAISWLSIKFNIINDINYIIFMIFIGVLILVVFLLSDRLRLKRKRFISRHFKRPVYDYQNIWETFTKRTISVSGITSLCSEIVKVISETLEILSVSIWLVDEKQEILTFGGSTVLTESQAHKIKYYGKNGSKLISAMAGQIMPMDLKQHEDDWVDDLRQSYDGETKEAVIRYCVPLHAAGRLIGIMTLSEKVFYEPLSFEDTELLKTFADQAAAMLLNFELSERLRQAREMEAFQTMSAFFVHDLKNLASKLSLVTQNLPKHLDNPEFREDALKTISQSVSKINIMSGRLSLMSQKLDLQYKETDLGELINDVVSSLGGCTNVPVIQELSIVPKVSLDPDEMKKVVENMLINARDATNGSGEIRITTNHNEKWVELSVIDNGCGMKKEFVEKHLFRPFQTTKQNGMGIGLFHCKSIVEAHGGRLEVETNEGTGSAFKIILPINR